MDKYKMIAKDIINKINSEVYTVGQKLQTESVMAQEYNVSRQTIRKSLEYLNELGYIRTRQGSGSYITNETEYRSLNINSFYDTYHHRNLRNKILYFETILSNPALEKTFSLSKVKKFKHWARLRYIDNNDYPTQLEYTFVPAQLVPNLTEQDLQGSFYRYIEKVTGHSIDYALKEIQAVSLQETEAHLFNLPVGSPAIMIRIIAYLTNGDVFETSTNFHVNQAIKYFARKI